MLSAGCRQYGLRFLCCYCVYFSAFYYVFSFEVCSYRLPFLCAGCAGEWDLQEGCFFKLDAQYLFHLLEVVGVVGCEVEDSARLKAPDDLLDVFGADESSFVMAGFWPWVGEIDVEPAYRVVGQVLCEEKGRVCPDYSDVFDLPPAEPVDGEFVISVGPFDAEVVIFGVYPGLADEKCALSRAYFYV